MKILKVEPRSREWHEVRNESWTASLAAVLVAKENAKLLKAAAAAKGVVLDIEPLLDVGIDDFFGHTLWTTWASKNGRIPRFQGNDATERGVRNEELVVSEFDKRFKTLSEREVTGQATGDEWLMASFDAMAPQDLDPTVVAPNGFPVEAKCPAFPSRKKLWDSRKSGVLAVLGLPYYWCQVQHQILVAEAPHGYFAAVGVEVDETTGETKPTFPIMEKVPRDDRFLEAYKAAARFYWETYIRDFEEPPLLDSDKALLASMVENAEMDKAIATGDQAAAVEMYLSALQAEQLAIARRKELEEKLISEAQSLRGTNTGVVLAKRLSVTFTETSSIQWGKLAKAMALKAGIAEIPETMLDAYRTKPSIKAKLQEV